ncbi:MAG: sigma-70 family RNA polymerase sigma factor [Burkholderiaceae bacterium]
MQPDVADLGPLYTAHHGWLQAWLRRRLGNACDAADLAHDAFVRLLLKPRQFDSVDGARAYLSTVARGLCVDLWRRREIEQAWLDALAARPQAVEPSAEQRVMVLQALVEIDAMLAALPPRPARAFVLAMVEERTDAEIAAELGVSDRMVRKYLSRVMLHCLQLPGALPAGADGGQADAR